MFFKDIIRVSLTISAFTILKPLRNDKRFILISALLPTLIKFASLDQVIILILVFTF